MASLMMASTRSTVATLTSLGQSATIAGETSADARTIWQTRYYDGNVFAGYGDWGAGSSGPTDVIYWDGSAFQSAYSALKTHATADLFVADGDLWAMSSDPTAGDDEDYVRVTGTTATLAQKTPPKTTHLFGGWEHRDGTLYLSGVNAIDDSRPSIWRSTDDGGSWTRVHDEAFSGGTQRYYSVFYLNGYFWCQRPLNVNAFRSSDGTTWSDAGFRITAGSAEQISHPVLFDGRIFFMSEHGQGGLTPNVERFDGTNQATYDSPINNYTRDIFVADGYLYAVVGFVSDTRVYRKATATASWSLVASMSGAVGRSGDGFDGTVWVGGTDSRLYRGVSLGTLGTTWIDGRDRQWVDDNGNFWSVS